MIRKLLSTVLVSSTLFVAGHGQASATQTDVQSTTLSINSQVGTSAYARCKGGVWNKRGWAKCKVYSGQVRLIAQCYRGDYRVSRWVGRGTKWLVTGKCRYGVKRLILQGRY